ncbi:MAG: hypothetical protein Q8O72_10550 [Bacteroidales bacterium]|nr:hypothetical protein [Bacteroidales bacterium]
MIEKKKANRFRVMAALYEFTNGSTQKWVDLKGLAAESQITGQNFVDAYKYLKDAKLIRAAGAGYTSFLTHNGIVEVEKAVTNPDIPTTHFPAVDDIGPVNGDKELL